MDPANHAALSFLSQAYAAAGQPELARKAGADKTQPLFEVLEGPPDPTRLPSQLIKPTPGALVWFVDRLAVAKLTHS